jgi:phospholipid/cholesterol/gamma-HCH transport system permease protein
MDLWGSVGKSYIFGLIIGIVCCYKGLAVKGGPAGVGRAVNQAVVAAFAGIWIFNYAWTNIILGLNPSMQIFK